MVNFCEVDVEDVAAIGRLPQASTFPSLLPSSSRPQRHPLLAMGNGQSSPASPHPHPLPAAQKHTPPSHRDNRPSSPGLANRRRKSLELPDLASLSFTNTSTPASSQGNTPATNGASPPSSGGKFSSLGRPGALGRKRPSPLAPAMSTTPLSPITTRTATQQHTTSNHDPSSVNSHNPYFPASGARLPAQTSTPVAIPSSGVQAPPLSSGLPDYSRMTYDGESKSHMPKSPPVLSNNQAPAPVAKRARIIDPKAHTISSPVPPPTYPQQTSAQPSRGQHRPQQPSVGGADEDNYIRSSLPLGGADSSSVKSTTPQAKGAVAGSSVDAAVGANEVGKKDLDEEMRDVEAGSGVPTIINWTGGGKEVFVCGTFAKNWGERVKMSKSTHDFTLVLDLPPGPHRLKFIVDESWRCSDDLATATDADGSLVNYIEVEPPTKDGDVKTDWEGEWDSQMGGVEPEDQSLWTTEIPQALIAAQATEEAHLNYIASLAPANRQPGSAALQNPPGLPNPPSLPRHLEKVILNNPPKDGGAVGVSNSGNKEAREEATKAMSASAACWTATPDDNSILPIPNHVVLNHLTASAIRNGTLAVGTTTRYKRKYISTLLYKPVEI